MGYIFYILAELNYPICILFILIFSCLFDFFLCKNQHYPVPEWQFRRCSNILEHLSLDFFFPKGQNFIHSPVTLDKTWTFQRDGIILLPFPIPSIYGFLHDFVIKFFSLTKPRGEQGEEENWLTKRKYQAHCFRISQMKVIGEIQRFYLFGSEGFFLDVLFFLNFFLFKSIFSSLIIN